MKLRVRASLLAGVPAAVRSYSLLLCVLLPTVVSARVFDMKELNFAPFVRGTFGPTAVGQSAFGDAAGANVQISGKPSYEYSGEIGMLYHLLPEMNIRFGAEILQPSPVVNAKGMNGSSLYYHIDSNIFVFNPNFAIELIMKRFESSRILLTAGAGYATVSVANTYTLTAAGATALSRTTFTEKGTGTAVSSFIGLGWEQHFVDQSMLLFELGYRRLMTDLSHSQNQQTIPETAGTKGGAFKNMDGSTRAVDLSGAYVGLSVRFYLL